MLSARELCSVVEHNRTKTNKTREGDGGLKMLSTAKGFIVITGRSLNKIVTREELS